MVPIRFKVGESSNKEFNRSIISGGALKKQELIKNKTLKSSLNVAYRVTS